MISSTSQLVTPWGAAVAYVVGLSIARGYFFPDFRLGHLSVVISQLAYPLLVVLPAIFLRSVGVGYSQCLLLGIMGLVVSQSVAMFRYWLEFGASALRDSVTLAVFVASFSAMVVVFAILLALVTYIRRG